jgi:MFS family permease
VAHGSSWEIYVAMLVMGVGIGFAFASMANLIVEAVAAHQTGVATGMNTIMRTIGGSLGAQVSATILAAQTSGGHPTTTAFTIAFGISAAVVLIAFGSALAIPGRARHVAATEPAFAHR